MRVSRRPGLTKGECLMLANILRFYLRNTPPRVAPDQRALAERLLDKVRHG
jgi:hypothetical protein